MLLRGSPLAQAGLLIIVAWTLVAIAAPELAPFPPNRSLQPMAFPGAHGPYGTFWLGTDALGRDILSRLIWGARTVLTYVPIATAFAFAVGIAAGLLAGYRRGWIDELLSRTADLVLAFPALVLYIVIISRFGPSGLDIVLAVTLASSPAVMRLTRGLVQQQRGRAYVAAAILRGNPAGGSWRSKSCPTSPGR